MITLRVSNIKCGGCEKMIQSSLKDLGMKNIKINIATQSVSFEGNVEAAKKRLSKLGYPEANSKKAGKLSKKAKSYLSCAIGRMKK